MTPDMPPKLLMIAALALLAACGKGDASCATNADCFKGEVCVKPQKVCEDPAKDLGADLAPDDMGTPDLAQPGDMAPDMEAVPANLPIQIAAGDAHTCALFGGGAVRCWGSNVSGQLGLGPAGPALLRDAALATDVELGAPAVAIAAGAAHTCALLKSDVVRCWGRGGHGQLGNGSAANVGVEDTPLTSGTVVLPLVPTVLAAGGNRTCAAAGGRVSCWGDNTSGALGRGIGDDRLGNERDDELGFVEINNRLYVHKIAANRLHTCMMISVNRLPNAANARCWGAVSQGRLGTAQAENIGDDETLTASANALTAVVNDLSAGDAFTCAVLRAGGILCWGDNSKGQLGEDDVAALPAEREPTRLPARDAVEVVAGDAFACARDSQGDVWCWGSGDRGQLGQPDQATLQLIRELRAHVQLSRPAIQLSAGDSHVCALLDDRSISCWGDNLNGQLGATDKDAVGLNADDFPLARIIFE